MKEKSLEAFDPWSPRPALQRRVHNGHPEKDKSLRHAIVRHTNKVPQAHSGYSLCEPRNRSTLSASQNRPCGGSRFAAFKFVSSAGRLNEPKGLPRDGKTSFLPQSFLDVLFKLTRVREKTEHARPIYRLFTISFDQRLTLHKPKSCYR